MNRGGYLEPPEYLQVLHEQDSLCLNRIRNACYSSDRHFTTGSCLDTSRLRL